MPAGWILGGQEHGIGHSDHGVNETENVVVRFPPPGRDQFFQGEYPGGRQQREADSDDETRD